MKSILIIIAVTALPLITFAQAGFAATDVMDTPADFGINLLAGAGVVYGAYKLAKGKQLINKP